MNERPDGRLPALEAALVIGSVVGALAVLASEAGRPLREQAASALARWRETLTAEADRPPVSGGRSKI